MLVKNTSYINFKGFQKPISSKVKADFYFTSNSFNKDIFVKSHNNLNSNVSFGKIATPNTFDDIYANISDFNGDKPDKFVLDKLQKFFPLDRSNIKVVDIGAGDGRNSLPIAKQGYNVTAIELSKVGTDLINEKADKIGLSDKVQTLNLDILNPDKPIDTANKASKPAQDFSNLEKHLFEIGALKRPSGFIVNSKEVKRYKDLPNNSLFYKLVLELYPEYVDKPAWEGEVLMKLPLKEEKKPEVTAEENIREAKISDVPEMKKLIDYYAEKGVLVPRTVEYLKEHLGEFVILEKDGNVIGCCALKRIGKDSAELRTIATDPKAKAKQNKDYGTLIMQQVAKKAKESGLDDLYCFTVTPKFFNKAGFEMVPQGELATAPPNVTNLLESQKAVVPKEVDAALLVDVTPHFNEEDLKIAFENISKMQKPGGIFITYALVNNGKPPSKIEKLLTKSFKENAGYYNFDADYILKIADESGYKLAEQPTEYDRNNCPPDNYVHSAMWGGDESNPLNRAIDLKWFVFRKS